MFDELISVIVPVYNVASFLKKCIYSILNQTYKELEVILVDDGSTDGSSDICDSFCLLDNRVHVYHKYNGGLSDARNYGIKKSKGIYLFFVDSDDYLDNEILYKLYTELHKTNSDMSMCNVKTIIEDTNRVICNSHFRRKIHNSKSFMKCFYKKNGWKYSVVWNKLYKRHLFNNISFPLHKNSEDNFVAHQIAHLCSKICLIDEPLYFHLSRSSGSIFSSKQLSLTINNIEYLHDRCVFFMDNHAYKSLRYRAFSQYVLYFYNHIDDINDENVKNNLSSSYTSLNKMYYESNIIRFYLPVKFTRIWIIMTKMKIKVKKLVVGY